MCIKITRATTIGLEKFNCLIAAEALAPPRGLIPFASFFNCHSTDSVCVSRGRHRVSAAVSQPDQGVDGTATGLGS